VVLKGFQYIIQRSLQAILKTGLLSSRFTNNKNVTILHGWMTLRPRSSLLARSLFRWYHLSSLILSSFNLHTQTITINYTKFIKNANAFMVASSSLSLSLSLSLNTQISLPNSTYYYLDKTNVYMQEVTQHEKRSGHIFVLYKFKENN